MPVRNRPVGIVLLCLFFWVGTLIPLLVCVALLSPGGALEPMWRLNPPARTAFTAMGPWALVLMTAVAAACGSAAAGLWAGKRWGRRLAVAVLSVNLLGDTANALIRGDWRALFGLPIGGLLLAYLLGQRVRAYIAESRLAAR